MCMPLSLHMTITKRIEARTICTKTSDVQDCRQQGLEHACTALVVLLAYLLHLRTTDAGVAVKGAAQTAKKPLKGPQVGSHTAPIWGGHPGREQRVLRRSAVGERS